MSKALESHPVRQDEDDSDDSEVVKEKDVEIKVTQVSCLSRECSAGIEVGPVAVVFGPAQGACDAQQALLGVRCGNRRQAKAYLEQHRFCGRRRRGTSAISRPRPRYACRRTSCSAK